MLSRAVVRQTASSQVFLKYQFYNNARLLATTNGCRPDQGLVDRSNKVDSVVSASQVVYEQRESLLRTGAFSPSEKLGLEKIPVENIDADALYGSCTKLENVVGFLPLPISVVGPLKVNGRTYQVPMATTDASLVARIRRGCRALQESGDVKSKVFRDGATFTPVAVLPSVFDASAFARFIEDPIRSEDIRHWFSEATGFGKLQAIKCQVLGRRVFIRFTATCGDSTGASKIPKGIERVLAHLAEEWRGNPFDILEETMESVEECGKSVAAEAVIPSDVIESILGTTAQAIVDANVEKQVLKNQITLGLNARRIINSVFLATGQEVAHRMDSALICDTLIEPIRSPVNPEQIAAVRVSCSMPSIDVGTIGAETRFSTQQGCLNLLGVAGSSVLSPGDNAQRLAEIICASVLACEVGAVAKEVVKHQSSASKSASIGLTRMSRPQSKRTSMQSPPIPEAARGVTSIKKLSPVEGAKLINAPPGKTHAAYIELVAEKCAAEFGWADPRLTVP